MPKRRHFFSYFAEVDRDDSGLLERNEVECKSKCLVCMTIKPRNSYMREIPGTLFTPVLLTSLGVRYVNYQFINKMWLKWSLAKEKMRKSRNMSMAYLLRLVFMLLFSFCYLCSILTLIREFLGPSPSAFSGKKGVSWAILWC